MRGAFYNNSRTHQVRHTMHSRLDCRLLEQVFVAVLPVRFWLVLASRAASTGTYVVAYTVESTRDNMGLRLLGPARVLVAILSSGHVYALFSSSRTQTIKCTFTATGIAPPPLLPD